MKKKIYSLMAILLIFLGITACNKVNVQEEVADKFLRAYYSQYEHKDLLAKIQKSELSETVIAEYYQEIFPNLVPVEAQSQLFRNRALPSFQFLETNIVKGTVSSIQFEKAKNELEGTLKFQVKVVYEDAQGIKTEKEATGLIRVLKGNQEYQVVGFEITSS